MIGGYLPPTDLLRFRLINRPLSTIFGQDNAGFYRGYLKDYSVRVLKTKTLLGSLTSHVRTRCWKCAVRGSRTVYPFGKKGLQLCRPCLYLGTINSHYLRDVVVDFRGLGTTHAVVTSFGRSFPTKWYWREDVDRRILEKTGYTGLEAYRQHQREEAQRKRLILSDEAKQLEERRLTLQNRAMDRAISKADGDEVDDFRCYLKDVHIAVRGVIKDARWVDRKANELLRSFRRQV